MLGCDPSIGKQSIHHSAFRVNKHWEVARFSFLFLVFTVTSIDLHLTFSVRCTKEKCILLRTPSILHTSLRGHTCPWPVQEWQTDNLAVYLTKASAHFPSAYQRWSQVYTCLSSSSLEAPLPRQGALVLMWLLPPHGSWTLLWVDKGQVLVFHKVEHTWQSRSMATFAASRPPFSPVFPIHMSSISSPFQTPGS